MTLNQLEYFCAVCRYRSITRAATELFVTQPTVSSALKDLEKELSLPLFQHGKNRITLTKEGEIFYKKAENLLTQTEELYNVAKRLKEEERPLRVGIPPMLSTIFFPSLLHAFHESFPDPVELHEMGSVHASEMVQAQELDLALVNLDFYNLEQFNYHVMMEENYVYCVSPEHPLGKEASVTFEALEKESILLFRTDSVQNRTIFARFHQLGIHPHILLYSSQLYTLEKFLKEGRTGAFLYSSIPISPSLVCLPLEPTLTTRIGVIWKKGAFHTPATEHFLSFLDSFDMEKRFGN